jgi:hypothetical protein
MTTAPMAVSTPVRCGDWLDVRTGRSGAADSVTASRRGFWIVAVVFAIVQAGGTLPIPLYVIWQPRFGFGAGVLTLIFAVYAVGTLLALVLISPRSDELGAGAPRSPPRSRSPPPAPWCS